jgi:hypothetical protein
MKRFTIFLLVFLLLALTIPLGAWGLPALPGLPDLPDLPDLPEIPDLSGIPDLPDITLPKIPIITPTPTPGLHIPAIPDITLPKIPIITPTPTPGLHIPAIPDITLPKIPIITPTPTPGLHLPNLPGPLIPIPGLPFPLPTPKPTDKPEATGSGRIMTSEGPPFMALRSDLTQEWWMFTPMDLSQDGEYRFPLIGDGNQVVGEAKVVVQSGMAVVTYLVISGIKVDQEDAFLTFFPDKSAVPSVLPEALQSVKLKFGMPYAVASWLGSDQKVLLYINCPVSYKTNLAGLAPFFFDDPAYLARLSELLPLMD